MQARQIANPIERIVLVGDFNAFEFNDGLGDSMEVIAGAPPPDNETAVPGDGVDLVNPDLDNLFDTPPPAERYSYVFDGNARTSTTCWSTRALVAGTVARRVEHPRINADFAETAATTDTTAAPVRPRPDRRATSRSPPSPPPTSRSPRSRSPDPVTAGTNLAYTITVTNGGPDPRGSVP